MYMRSCTFMVIFTIHALHSMCYNTYVLQSKLQTNFFHVIQKKILLYLLVEVYKFWYLYWYRGQYQQFLMVLESVKDSVQVPILLFEHYYHEIVFSKLWW